LKFFEQTLIEKFLADFDFEKSNAMTISIEKAIRNNQTLIFRFQLGTGRSASSFAISGCDRTF